jgi:prepilin-type N-terminal cleavage/methylation domain-containing protein
MKTRNLNGFTFTEIMVTLIIIGVMAVVILPNMTVYFERAKYGEALSILKALRDSQQNYKYENRTFTNDIDLLDMEVPAMKNFAAPVLNTADPLASLTNNSNTYTLSIDEDGTIHCADIGGSGLCAKLKCTQGSGDECN